jgi:diaminopimelate epimerase
VVASLAHAGLAPTDVDVRVRLPGGALFVRVPSGEGSVWMTGPARIVFDGAIDV